MFCRKMFNLQHIKILEKIYHGERDNLNWKKEKSDVINQKHIF